MMGMFIKISLEILDLIFVDRPTKNIQIYKLNSNIELAYGSVTGVRESLGFYGSK